ncbi:hypothetical protein DIPPA_16321 [Diplonema papillatum]|nr:hypothetical protein DIPPA_16321 [Diplonema papillatum]
MSVAVEMAKCGYPELGWSLHSVRDPVERPFEMEILALGAMAMAATSSADGGVAVTLDGGAMLGPLDLALSLGFSSSTAPKRLRVTGGMSLAPDRLIDDVTAFLHALASTAEKANAAAQSALQAKQDDLKAEETKLAAVRAHWIHKLDEWRGDSASLPETIAALSAKCRELEDAWWWSSLKAALCWTNVLELKADHAASRIN